MADTIEWLYGLGQFGIKFGLDNMQALMAALGHPERAFASVHVAGTNGKGSVTALVDRALTLAGLRCGRYTSPHLLSLSERIVVDGSPIEAAALVDTLEEVRAAVSALQASGQLDVHPTFFEVTTAAAFVAFRRAGVEVATCEVGLGGRLDATNVLAPTACAITSIGFDHMQYLGNTLAQIAAEKAGIIKSGVRVVVGPVPAEAAAPIASKAASVGAPVIWSHEGVHVGTRRVDRATGRQHFALRTPARDYGEVDLALAGRHQVDNAVVAVRLLETVATSLGVPGVPEIQRALASAHWPGRLDLVTLPDGRAVLLDAAHNQQGAEALAAHLEETGIRAPVVFAAMRDKDASSMIRALTPAVSRFIVTRASNPRSADPASLADVIARVAPTMPVELAESPERALALALERSAFAVVAGSIFLLADVMKRLPRP